MPTPLFTFITTNAEKIKSAKHYLDPLNIPFSTQSLDLTEIQSSSIEEIAKFKAHQAFAILKKPVLVSDHGWAFHALNGFPGAYMKEVNKWFTPQDFLNLLKDKQDRSVTRIE